MSTPASTAARLKLHATSLDASGDPSRNAWLVAAKAELNAVDTTNDAAFRDGVAETVACLASACRPMLKEEVRMVVRRFLNAMWKQPALQGEWLVDIVKPEERKP